MNKIFKHFFKEFILFTVLGICIFGLLGLMEVSWLRLDIPTIIMILFFNTIFPLIYYNYMVDTIKKLGFETPVVNHFSSRQNVDLKTKMSLTQLYNKLVANPYYKKVKLDVSENSITCYKDADVQFPGDVITIKYDSIQGHYHQVNISSQPKFKIIYHDWGSNLTNIVQLKKLLV